MGKPGKKSLRGVAELRDEPKTEAVYLKLTKTGKALLEDVGKRSGSQAEFVERAVRDGLAFSHFKQEDRFSTVAFLENLLALRRDEMNRRGLWQGRRTSDERERAIALQIIELEDLIEKLSF